MAIKQKIDLIGNRILIKLKRLKFVNRFWNKSSTLVQTKSLMFFYIAFMILFITGIVNALVEGINIQTQAPIIPNFQAQTLAEVIMFSTVILCGTFGLIFITRGTKQVSKGRTTAAYIISGLGLVAFGLIIGFFLVALKGG